jgi:histone chaperone ASF1
MSSVNVSSVQVLDNACPFATDFRFEVTFDCVAPLDDGAYSTAADNMLSQFILQLQLLLYSFSCMRLVVRADLEWRVVYVGSASSSQYDQELENVLVGPVPLGTSKFVLQVRNHRNLHYLLENEQRVWYSEVCCRPHHQNTARYPQKMYWEPLLS